MSSLYETSVFLIVIVASLVVALIAGRNKLNESKLLVYVSLFSIMVYSGLGISLEQVSNKYIFDYILFIILFAFSLSIGLQITTRWKWNSGLKVVINAPIEERDIIISDKALRILTICFFVTLFIPLIYPNFRLLDFFRLPSMNIGDIYMKIGASKANVITKLASTLQTFLLPFFMIYLNRYDKSKNKWRVVLIIILWIYLDYLQFTYLGRYDIAVYTIFLMIYLLMFDGKNIQFKARTMAIFIVIVVVVMLPALNALVYIREGWQYTNNGLIGNILNLVESEIYYPKYYDVCQSAYDGSQIGNFFGWLVTLPIPSVLWPGKPDLTVTYDFTYILTGRVFGQANYSSLLPSILGEGYMIFGPSYYWVSALVTGLICGSVFGYLSKYKETLLFMSYLALLSAKMGRAGVASFLPTVINGTLSIMIYLLVSKKYRATEAKRSRKNVFN